MPRAAYASLSDYVLPLIFVVLLLLELQVHNNLVPQQHDIFHPAAATTAVARAIAVESSLSLMGTIRLSAV